MNAHHWTLRDIATSAGGALLDTLHAARVLAEEGALALGRVFERAAKCPECGDKNVAGHADVEHAGDEFLRTLLDDQERRWQEQHGSGGTP